MKKQNEAVDSKIIEMTSQYTKVYFTMPTKCDGDFKLLHGCKSDVQCWKIACQQLLELQETYDDDKIEKYADDFYCCNLPTFIVENGNEIEEIGNAFEEGRLDSWEVCDYHANLNCKNCTQCERCDNCNDCDWCICCHTCYNCYNCDSCDYCTKCTGCVTSIYCEDCISCDECESCWSLTNDSYMRHSTDANPVYRMQCDLMEGRKENL